MTTPITLTVAHNIFLTKEERYKLHAGETIEVIGVSIPVWFKKGTTSEPAQEVFCLYKLMNEAGNRAIMQCDGGYSVNLPQQTSEDDPSSVKLAGEIPTSDRLLDIKDGGSEWLEFRQYNKVHQGKLKFNVVHFVEIKPIELLQETLTL